MKTSAITAVIFTAVVLFMLSGCASPDPYQDSREYSDMPWNTSQEWEGSRSIPGLSPTR